jgi:hypothetical protein
MARIAAVRFITLPFPPVLFKKELHGHPVAIYRCSFLLNRAGRRVERAYHDIGQWRLFLPAAGHFEQAREK